MSQSFDSLLPPGNAAGDMCRKLDAEFGKAMAIPQVRAALAEHQRGCGACAAEGVCREALGIVFPPARVAEIYKPDGGRMDTLRVLMERKSTFDLKLLGKEAEDAGTTNGRWYKTAMDVLKLRQNGS